MLIDLAASAQLFHNPIDAAYADLLVDGRRETWPVRSPRFRAWLRRRYYAATGEAPSAAELGSTLNLLEARAQFDGPERTVHVRLAEHAGQIYLDLADRDWRAVEIGPHGWKVVAEPSVRFRRPAGLCRCRCRNREGRSTSLPHFSICRTEMTWCWSRHGFWPRCAPAVLTPLLVIAGEQGSAKTVLSKLLRALVDPNVAPVRTLPHEERDLFIAAKMAMSWLSIISPPCRPGCRTRSADWRVAAALPSASSTPTRTRCCSRPPARSSSMASRMWSRARISPTAGCL
jgi:hypothetical protein